MSYNDLVALFTLPTKEESELIERRARTKCVEHEYEFVRYGTPTGSIDFEKEREGREVLIKHFIEHGYSSFPARKLNEKLKKHIALFRCNLDLWEELCGEGSMSKSEIYYRSLTEGAPFADWVKKARSMSLKAYSTETNTPIEEEYVLHDYKGYNSIIHERYLPNWDGSDEVDDVKYAFIPRNDRRLNDFRIRLRRLFDDFRVNEIDISSEFDMIGALKTAVMYDPIKKKSILMKEFWNEDIEINEPYYAVRRVVPIEAGNIRDTGVGTPGTILKVKQLNKLARAIHEVLPYSANAASEICNRRLKRVLKKNAFLHLDFKKFGLTCPRGITNIIIEEMGSYLGIDTDHLKIDDFFIEIDGEAYQTERGSVLGWMDSVNSLAVIAILHWLITDHELEFDFITFNDDVEIGKFAKSDVSGTLELLRSAIIVELDSFDFLISLSKTYGSKGSVFLERYAYYGVYGLDMYKEQLTVKAYGQSLVTTFPWQAKLYHSAANLWTKSEYATDRCIKTCPVEFRPIEASLSLWSGGWFAYDKNGLDLALKECDPLGYLFGLELSKYRVPKYSSRLEGTSNPSRINIKVNNNAYYANSSSLGALMFEDIPQVSEVNEEIEDLKTSFDSLIVHYQGRNEMFPLRISNIVRQRIGEHFDGG